MIRSDQSTRINKTCCSNVITPEHRKMEFEDLRPVLGWKEASATLSKSMWDAWDIQILHSSWRGKFQPSKFLWSREVTNVSSFSEITYFLVSDLLDLPIR
jgi:hypothetical protein